MKIRLLCTFLLSISISFISSAAKGSQLDSLVAADYFCAAPSDWVSELTPVNRLDMIDYYKSGSSVGVENRLGAKVRILSMDDRHVTWQDEDSVKCTLVLLREKDLLGSHTGFMMIRTFNRPMPDSNVYYFEEDWSTPCPRGDILGLPGKFVGWPYPDTNEWLISKNKNTRKAVDEAIPFILWTAEFDLDNDELIFINRTAELFAPDDMPIELQNLKPEIHYKWTTKGFRRAKTK